MATKQELLKAKKLLEQHAPKGEFLAYINKDEAQVLKNLGGSGRIVEETQIPSFETITNINRPAPYIEALGEDYAAGLKKIVNDPFTSQELAGLAPQVAGQTNLQKQATSLTGQGIGSYQPFVTAAQQAGTTAGTGLGLAQTGLGIAGQELTGAGTTLGAAGTQLTGAQSALGAAGQTIAGASPFTTAAATGLGQAGTTLGGTQGFIGAAGTGLGAAGALTGTGAGTGAGSLSSYMSPFQSQVIDTTLADFDRQAAQRQQSISDQAVALGGFGGGREGVMQAEYQSGSDRNRAALQAQLQSQGFSQAQAARQADLQNQMALSQGQLGLGQATGSLAAQQAQLAQGQLGLGQAQLGIGSAQAGVAGQQAGMAAQRGSIAQQQAGFAGQRGAMAGQQAGLAQGQLGLGQFQTGLGQAQQGFQGTDISRAGAVGAADQSYAQSIKDAQREANRQTLYEPMERFGFYGSGLGNLSGSIGGQYQFSNQPGQSPLQNALGLGSTLSGIYKNFQ